MAKSLAGSPGCPIDTTSEICHSVTMQWASTETPAVQRVIGLMSGTSADGVDAALVEIQEDNLRLQVRVLAHATYPYDAALRAAGLQPSRIRKRRAWDKPLVIRALRASKAKGVDLSSTSLRHEDPALYGAAIRLFGGLPAARAAAGIRSR